MITHHKVDGYDNFIKLMSILDCKGVVILYFCGSPNPLGQSGPIVHNVLKQNETKNFHFVHVGVGTANDWKDPYCPFKTHERLQLKSLPSIILWRQSERLTGKECLNADKVKAMIEYLP
ncbi:hypothetical protein RUM44_008733 [Polyplax serrata]|uniref:Thioredoxin domain-containing protein 17 n=1 Tax=Polyplax serrata TaxID=468196 RepID=A0ABR1BB14_POLSC